MYVNLHTKFQVSGIILTNFRQGMGVGESSSPTLQRASKKPTQTGVKSLALSAFTTVPVEAFSANEEATLNFLGREGFDRTWKGSSVIH